MIIDGIVENKGINYIAYTFLDNAYFYETGYKVLRANIQNGYIPCNYMVFNGRICLLYNIENRNTLNSVAKTLSPNAFANLILNIIDGILQMKDNGFIHIESVDFDASNIYVDIANLKPYFIYVPINMQSTVEGFFAMENFLRQSLLHIIQSNANLNSELINRIIFELSDYTKSLSDIKNNIQSMMEIYTDGSSSELHKYTQSINSVRDEKTSGKLRKIRSEKKKAGKSYDVENLYGTTVLTDNFIPSIMLVSVDTLEAVNMVIDKSDFLIGHKFDEVDGYIGFNSSVSRTHCRIKNINGRNYIVDLNSANGTWLNGKRINSGKELEITPGDRIKISNVEFLVSSINKVRGNNNE